MTERVRGRGNRQGRGEKCREEAKGKMAARRGREWDGDELGGPPQTPLAAPVVCLLRSAGDLAAGAFVGSLVGYGAAFYSHLISPFQFKLESCWLSSLAS